MPPRRATSARKPPSAPRRPRREIRTYEDAVQAIQELQPEWESSLYVNVTTSMAHRDNSRSSHFWFCVWTQVHGERVSVEASSPRDLVRKCIEELFPKLVRRALPAPPKPTPSTVVDPAVRPLPGQRTLCLPGPGG